MTSSSLVAPVLLALPWLLFGVWAAVRVRWPRPLPPVEMPASDLPLVSVIVPARNEEVNIEACLRSIAASTHPAFEILVVDDRSDDRTAELAAAVPEGRARRLEVIRGRELPEGWIGKPWACDQGAEGARGELLLFTDADTRHEPELLTRAVAALKEDRADLLTIVPRQRLESFWEKVVQPHVFVLLALRFNDLREPLPSERWKDAIANGQFMLLRRDPYRRIGGHEAVKGEVVEDLRLAQEACRGGLVVSVRDGEDAMATRMYRSLSGLLEGWTKNLATGLRQARGWIPEAAVVPAALAALAGLWIAPPAVLVAAVLGFGGLPLLTWAGVAVGGSVAFWAGATWRSRISPAWGLSYPLGALVLAWIILRSWRRGRRIEWRGRVYGVGTR